MSAKIVVLKTYRKSGVIVSETGLVFPQLYRQHMRPWKWADHVPESRREGCLLAEGDLVPDLDHTMEPSYTLDQAGQRNYAAPTWEMMSHLDKERDGGYWVIVRHHKSREAVESYLDGYYDMETHEGGEEVNTYHLDIGHFTVLQRKPKPGTPSHLLIYQANLPLNARGLPEYWTKVFDHTGEEVSPDVMMAEGPEKESFGQLAAYMKDQSPEH